MVVNRTIATFYSQLAAVRGGIGFLTRIPVGSKNGSDWQAFQSHPLVLPIVGYGIGAVFVIPFLLPLPIPLVALVFVSFTYAVTGLNHLDGLADLGDALAVHGDIDDRHTARRDPTLGVGGVMVVVIVLIGLVLGAILLAGLPRRAAVILVTAEVSAKLGMVVVGCLGTPSGPGLGAALSDRWRATKLVAPFVVAVPAAFLNWPSLGGILTLGVGVLTAGILLRVTTDRLGGVSGDVFGATNEITRLVAIHVGVLGWMYF